jgi:O-6-methylguanine DNA methyltransferase
MGNHFTSKEVYLLVSQIPRGRVSTYGAIARALNAEMASRAIGQILKANPTPVIVPCHRVVMSNGEIGGYGGARRSPKKEKLLRSEGLKMDHGKIDDFQHVFFEEFSQITNR